MNRGRRLSLQIEISLATFVPLLMFAALSGALGAYALERIPEELVLQRQTVVTRMAAAGLAGNFRGYVRLLQTVADELGNEPDLSRAQPILSARATMLTGFSAGAAYLDNRGTAVAAVGTQQAAIGLNYAYRPYFQTVRDSLTPAFSPVLQDYPRQFNAVAIAVPVQRNGRFAGVLVGEIALAQSEWTQDLDLLRTPQGGVAYLIDGNGTVLYHPDPVRIASTLRSDPALWSLAAGGQPGSVVLQPLGGAQSVVASIAPIPGTTWSVVTEDSWPAILSVITPYEEAVAGLMAAGILLAAVVLFFSVRRVTRPISALVAEARRVASGEAFHVLPTQGPADVQVLLTQVNRMVARLQEQQAELRDYAQRVVQAQEDERLRLSRELHDETVQDLVGLAQRIELCVGALPGNPAVARTQLQEVHALATRTASEVRRLSNRLRPAILEDLGLAAAVRVLANELQERLPLAQVGCEVVGQTARLSPDMELAAFRICQEALVNIRKHAPSAACVSIALVYQEREVLLLVEDDGPGYAVEEMQAYVRAGHLGLAGMAERARPFGGEVTFLSALGEGTTVRLRLPRVSEHAQSAGQGKG